jgi:hypothetical protein
MALSTIRQNSSVIPIFHHIDKLIIHVLQYSLDKPIRDAAQVGMLTSPIKFEPKLTLMYCLGALVRFTSSSWSFTGNNRISLWILDAGGVQ